ncbi:DUF6527 family protein [Pandoraea terrigena]|uniref:Ammonia monooxygenase n=1 Tax=Pandoraea terrigena TaxID=2508292 RepID=A0A5E4YL41_9BURK|nr:DUF6527 family protein [Pandoraea terrigena]VVE49252.1 hypothetical protein PTE31013_04620 [Pandoraea terrigena]
MSRLSNILRGSEGNGLSFWCPGCGHPHRIQHGAGKGPRWNWNGNVERPTFTPSVLVTWNEPSDNPSEFEDQTKDVGKACHSFVTDGHIQFLSDCTHALAGQTVALPPFPAGWGE